MIQRLLTATDWDFAGLKFTNDQPMLVERGICTVKEADDTDFLVIHVENGAHPFTKGEEAATDYYVSKKSITGITFYREKPKPIIQTLNKPGKIIAQA